MNRRAKIVCTLGPATATDDAVRRLVETGMDVARLNFSHGTHAEHAAHHARVRRAASESGRAVAILADLQGPKIRLGRFESGSATLETGSEFTLTTESVTGDARRASTTYASLPDDVRPGNAVLLDDGRVRLEVLAVEGREVRTRVVEGGRISDRKGINLPGVAVSAPTLTEKDLDDLRFALALPVDLVALSFVRGPEDAALARRAMGNGSVPLIAKIERPEAVERLDQVIDAFDGILVARGDLGVEMPAEQVPLVQKRAVRLARCHAKPVFVATQMLESMIESAQPTRAEVSDVANAVLDGADALMLSGETSTGAHPIEAAATMARIITATEADPLADHSDPSGAPPPVDQHQAIAAAASRIATDLDARALIAYTQRGATARRLASHRPRSRLVAFTTDPTVRNRLAAVWGVETFVLSPVPDSDAMVAQVNRAMLELEGCRPGDRVVVVAGIPFGSAGVTNTIRVHRLDPGSV